VLGTCECPSSDSLSLLGCGSDLGTAAIQRISADGRVVAFELCSETSCVPYYSTPELGTISIPGPSGGASVTGMTEDGSLVLLHPRNERSKPELYDANDGSSTPLELRSSPLLLSAEGAVFGVTTPKAGKSTLSRVLAGVTEALGDLAVTPDRVALEAATPDGELVVGSITRPDGYEPFRWSAAGGLVVGLEGLPEATPNATFQNVSRDGSTFSGFLYSGREPRSAFLWTETGGLLELAASRQEASYSLLSDDGAVLVTSLDLSATDSGAFRWTQNGGAVALLASPANHARVMNSNGALVFGDLSVQSHTEDASPFVWTAAEGARNLREFVEAGGVDLTNVRLYSPSGLSRDGRVAVGAASCRDAQTIYRYEIPE
jgi:hypothetical protein